jgi:hypothetical protein
MSQKETESKQAAATELDSLRRTWQSSGIFLPDGVKQQMEMLQEAINEGRNSPVKPNSKKMLK